MPRSRLSWLLLAVVLSIVPPALADTYFVHDEAGIEPQTDIFTWCDSPPCDVATHGYTGAISGLGADGPSASALERRRAPAPADRDLPTGRLPWISPGTPEASTRGNPVYVTFATNKFRVPEGETLMVVALLTRNLTASDPDQVTVDYVVEPGHATAGRDFLQPPSGTFTFVKGESRFLSFPLETLDDAKHEGTERVILRLLNPVDVIPRANVLSAVSIVDDDPYDPLLLEDFEDDPDLWSAGSEVRLGTPEIADDDPRALPGQGAFEGVLEATVPRLVDIDVQGRICNRGRGVVPVVLWTTDRFDATTVDHTTVTLGDAHEAHVDRSTGLPRRHEEDVDNDGDLDLVFHFRFDQTGLACDPEVVPFSGATYAGTPVTAGGSETRLVRDFALGRDWSAHEGLQLWFYGQDSGDEIGVDLLDNRAPDPGPDGWELVWSDEFDGPAGAPPDPAHWTHEIGDGTLNGIPGWGNAERQTYTDSPDNAATDGQGNLVITAREADGSEFCYYGPCEYTSARLVSWRKTEFAYGRIESRILMPDGDDGLWPAFWGLGTDIDQVGWPQSGEIDITEYVSRVPYEVFGTAHGPGYSGANAFGGTYSFPEGVSADYHTFAIEWQPDRIDWYVDDILYHTATPGLVAPNEWVFNNPIFLITNLAIGGYFGGAVSPETTFPQSLAIDYVRVYQGPDSAERWTASFRDDFVGWQEIEIPFGAFRRAVEQPAGAPDDGLNLDEVWGYGLSVPGGSPTGRLLLDQIRLSTTP